MSEVTAAKQQPADDEAGDLMHKVGERVRKARELKGLPRRIISERSGVSPRYLAQLEAGDGNISIGLLKKIATALDHRIEWLVGDEDPWTSETLRIADLYRSAPAVIRQQVLKALSPETPEVLRVQRICLIGLRGAGKSTLGDMAGEALGVPFVELNRYIEDHAGMPVNEI
ncbi:MAG: helix-turn-helix domain-containing protein, partial [Geminicoccaceae bacterium]